MTPYKIELTWQENSVYLFTVYTKEGKVMLQEHVSKDRIPEVMAKYLCVFPYAP